MREYVPTTVEMNAYVHPKYPIEQINSPRHYLPSSSGSIECIEAMEEMLESEEFAGYLRGNVFKYLWRCMYKGATVKDLEKAEWYLKKLIKVVS